MNSTNNITKAKNIESSLSKTVNRKMNNEKQKTIIDDLDRGIYDIKDEFDYGFKTESGLTPEIVREISSKKNEPTWMTKFRLKSLQIYNNLEVPPWGPDISELDIDNIITYVKPKTDMKTSWDDVPSEIKNTFTRLGIPQAEHASLAGVGAQYDSEVVYHKLKENLLKQGVIYTDMESALRDYEEVVKKYFMTCVPPSDHKFAALHGAVWSGGSFVHIPEGVHVDIPLQSYFRSNAPGAGQFEHTLIIVEKNASLHFIEGCSAPKYSVNNLHAGCVELFVKENARLRYSTIENWSKNMFNLNTKRCIVEKDGLIEWVSGSFGSKVSMLYPMSVLKGEGARSEFTGVTFAGHGQHLDTGTKVIHAAPYTTSVVNTKSISKDGGSAVYRGSLKVLKSAHHSKATISCESLMMDNISTSDTIPAIALLNDEVDIGHEAKIGRISDDAIFYLMSRGVSEEEARAMIVRGFVEPIAKELPLEYAIEMNNLIKLELEGTIG
jgi:Fe-S cluster assembly protein SufB